MYEIPKRRRAVRKAVTREDVEEDRAAAEFKERLLDLVENDPAVRIAIRNALEGGTRPARLPRPTTTQPLRRGRGR
ncbi:hypothetical protein [Streptomyces noursei]|uniref:hypothetical protein n=1 Tax=Streptomyces noursei TaxID=1971 RepID=UPI0035DC9882